MNATRLVLVGVAAALLPFASSGVEYNPPIDLGSLGISDSWPRSMNNVGDVVGQSGWGADYFLWTPDGGMQEIQKLSLLDGFVATAINDRRQIVGYANNTAYLYEDNVVKLLGTSGGGGGALDINNLGQIVGGSKGYPVVFGGGARVYEIEALLGHRGQATAINDAGQIAGTYVSDNGDGVHQRAFLVDGAVAKDLGTMGGRESRACDINNAGQVVGWVDRNGVSVAFLYDNGQMHDLGEGQAVAINDAGQILGTNNTSPRRMLFWTPARERIELYFPGWESSYGVRINNRGWIAGADGLARRAFLLVPIEQKTLSLKMVPYRLSTALSMVWPTFNLGPHQLLASDDLGEWVPLGEPVSPVLSIVRFLDPDAPGLTRRFYRLEVLPQ